MGIVKNFVTELEEEVREEILSRGLDFVAEVYGAPKDLSEEELVDFCVSVEYENAFI